MATPVTQAAKPTPAPGTDIVAKASTEYRVKRYLMVLLLVGWGVWSLYDGYVAYPRENAEIARLKKDIAGMGKEDPKLTEAEAKLRKLKERTSTDIFLNQALGWVLPVAGILMLVLALRSSRGQYRLRGNVLSVPGHPPVPLEAIRSVDKSNWDRKGIAHINYALPNGKTGRLRLDDFIYERQPTDEIFKRIEEHTGEGSPGVTSGA